MQSHQVYPHSSQWDKVDQKAIVRGTKETEPRPTNGSMLIKGQWIPVTRPNTEARYKTYTIEQIRLTHIIRERAMQEKGADGMVKLLPPLPCPYKICAQCVSFRQFWDKALADEMPHTLSLL